MSTSSPPTPSPDEVLQSWQGMLEDDFGKTIRSTFNLPDDDDYVYRADAFAMTLAEIERKLKTPLKYTYSMHHEQFKIPSTDITAYTSIFSPTTDAAKALMSFASNAKKNTPRSNVSAYLKAQRLMPSSLKPTRSKTHRNPYYDVWVYSCLLTDFVGPLSIPEYSNPQTAKLTHPLLPVLYHHFGCVCPTYESLWIIKQLLVADSSSSLSAKRGVVDMASGNGYWTCMLRKLDVDVVAVDNKESSWRYNWIDDTIAANGVEWLRRNAGARDRVLLMVYMVTKGDFTKNILAAYKGDCVVVVGTQNENRYTGFSDVGVEEYFAREMVGFQLIVRIALPSFAAKDDAMFVFRRVV